MPPLADLQQDFARAILAGAMPDVALAPGHVPAADAMRVYRNTVIGALVNALRLTYPSIDALLGEAFFDQAAATFAKAHPPASGRLAGYGEGFIAFLPGHVPSLPYLADVARLDWAMAPLSLDPRRREGLVWRKGGHVLSRAIRSPAARFVEAMLAGKGADAALAGAMAASPDAAEIIQTEIFSASFCTIGAKP